MFANLKLKCIDEYGLYVVSLAAAKLDPVEACTAFRVCKADLSRDVLRKLREIN